MSEIYRRTLTFSGCEWAVKGSTVAVGPGPNLFSDRDGNVWVDDEGGLHLKITKHGREWRCAEVVSRESFGYGRYAFHIGGGAEAIDENAVLGLFTWDTAPDHHNREIDIEVSRWGEPENENCQYVVQPYDEPAKLHRFELAVGNSVSVHLFDWRPGRVAFESLAVGGEVLASYTYAGDDVPPAGEEQARINLWLIEGRPPSNGREIEIVVERFEFSAVEG